VNFKLIYSSYFVFIIEGLVQSQNLDILEEFLMVQLQGSIHSRYKSKHGKYYGNDWLIDYNKKLLSLLWYIDLSDYESDYGMSGYHFGENEGTITAEFSYDTLAEEIIGEIVG